MNLKNRNKRQIIDMHVYLLVQNSDQEIFPRVFKHYFNRLLLLALFYRAPTGRAAFGYCWPT